MKFIVMMQVRVSIAVIFLVLLLVTTTSNALTSHVNSFPSRPVPSSIHLQPALIAKASAVLDKTTEEIEGDKPHHIVLRFPSAVGSTVKTVCLTFLQSACFMIPVGLLIKVLLSINMMSM